MAASSRLDCARKDDKSTSGNQMLLLSKTIAKRIDSATTACEAAVYQKIEPCWVTVTPQESRAPEAASIPIKTKVGKHNRTADICMFNRRTNKSSHARRGVDKRNAATTTNVIQDRSHAVFDLLLVGILLRFILQH